MDGHLKRRMRQMAEQLAAEEKERLEKAGTFVEMEDLVEEIANELARQLAGVLLENKADEVAQQPVHSCPDCGRDRSLQPQREPMILQSPHGEIEYTEPYAHCPSCRRDFSPTGRSNRTPGS